ncbi:ABC transporter permease [Devosia sp.]|uniref:ABC transporter permease n=1 Tax=Devosia sp. TaxID=1871048 RepID=UPI00086B428B|nr:ABC transporter permease [Devosia sp.]ODT81038.1 MAG: ABC transporter permease [Pelagibacterium sp. SCN 64-44]
MTGYIIRRLMQFLPVLLGTTFIVFCLAWGMPGDPLAGKCGDRECPEAYVALATEQFHLDQPLVVRYGYYVADLVRGDLGTSFTGRQVSEQLMAAFPATIRLALLAVTIEVLFGVAIGIASALRPGKGFDTGNLLLGLVIIAFPGFVIANLAQLIFGVRLGWFPVTVNDPSSLYQLLLPAIVLALGHQVTLSRLTRTAVLESLESDYVRTAHTKGLRPSRIVGIHVLRNSLIPVVTYIGKDIGGLMAGAVVTESVFNIQGVGGLIVRSIRSHDGVTIVGAVTVIVVTYLVINLLVDIAYAALDPRIRYD